MTVDTANSIWQGKNIRLRAIEPPDWEAYFGWNQDDDLNRRLYNIPFPQSQEAVKRWAEKEAGQERTDDNFRFVIVNDEDQPLGSISTHNCNRRMGAFWYGIHIGREHRQKGYASEAIVLVLRYYFEELRYQKANATVYSFNAPSLRLHEKIGFVIEGRLRRMGFTEGKYFDHVLFGMTAEEFVDRYSA